MKKIYDCWRKRLSIIVFILSFLSFQKINAQTLAFPGAEGFGKYATGGRYGSVYHVTNLNNSGPGSLRDAISAPNRIVVFDVAGVIRITERMIVSSNIYLAGQTAPGEGITVYGNGWSFSNAHNTICRYMKIRMGIVGSSGVDANGLASGHDIIFDHCSVSWGRDENFSINSTTAQNITIQNSIISQGLLTHSAGGLMQCDGGITLYRNLYADNGTRNNKVKGVSQYVNNIVYNWGAGAYIMGGESSGESFVNVTNNCFIQGPVDGVQPLSLGNSLFHIYATDNIYDNNRNGALDPYTIPRSEYEGPPDFQASPYAYPQLPTVPSQNLVAELLPSVGASLPYRDYADYYVVNEVRSFGQKGELIANESVLPFGAPTSWNLWTGFTRPDSDNDGMPDAWETTHGTNPSVDDAMILTSSGYTNIENYINSITADNSQQYLRAPLKLKLESATPNSLTLSWLDYTEKEQGYIVERKVGETWEKIGTTGVNVNNFTIAGMQPEEAGTFRVKAYNATSESAYSNELTVKTKPVEVPVLDPNNFTPDLTWTGAVSQNWDKTTYNWLNQANTATTYFDNSKILFPEAGAAGKGVLITGPMGADDILVNSNGNYSFSGTGYITGSKSLNKAGSGTLSLQNNNTYTGATVLHAGTIELNQLANGGIPSSIGASANYGFNWVWKGGKWAYTGGNASTDRNAVIDATTEFNVSNSASTVTLSGVLSGDGGLIKSGAGKLVLKSANPYAGETIINGGTIEVFPVSSATEAEDIIDNGQAIGTSNILRLHNGTYKTSNGSTTIYENYPMQLYVDENTVNGFEPYRNANLAMTVHGKGTLNYAIPYLRELVQGDWSDFTGTLVANGVNTTDGSILMIDNGIGFPNNRVVTTGNTKIATYQNNNNIYIGGLSGDAGTMLSCGGTKSPTFGYGLTTYYIGGSGTDETFNGVINNHLYGNSADGYGATTIVKEGEGLWRLNGNNTYIGTTTVNGGKLIINGSHTGTGKVTVSGGATLAGKGTIAAEVDVTGVLEPGDGAVGTLTLKDKLTLQPAATTSIDIDKTAKTWDKVSVAGNIAYDGTLKINFTGTPASGDVFKIFSTPAAISGSITQFEPSTPGPGLLWVFKPATGELAIQTPNFVEAPSNLNLNAPVVKAGAPGIVNCSWSDNSDNEEYFILERSTDNQNFVDVGHPAANTTSYSDGGLQSGMKYYYRIKAHSPLNESNFSPVVSVTTPAAGTLPSVTVTPSPLNNATNVFLDDRTTSLSWSGNYADVYDVYLGTGNNNLVKVAEVPAGTAAYTPATLEPNTKYYWRIDARNDNGTTTGTVWNFQTANIPVTAVGDYRSAASGNWGTSSVATAIWEVFDGTNWNSTTTLPSSATPTVTIKTGHTVRLNATTTVNNLVIESGATLVSGTSDGSSGTATQRNLRVISSINNYGTVGSSSTSTNRINFEGYRRNGTVSITGTSTYYLNTFTVNSIAQTTEVVIDANLNLASYMRANYSTSTTLPWTSDPQNDDNISVTINEGKTVTMSSSGYLQAGSSPTTNTIAEFGNYTFNINGTLDMRSTGTSCIVAHSTNANSHITINVNGTWLTGNAMRFASTAATKGTMSANIGPGGVVDAGARTINSSNTATNMVFFNSLSGQIFYNISGDGVLKTKVSTSEVLFPVGSDNTYSPVKLTNTGTADIVAVGVKTGLDYPVGDPSKLVNKQYSVIPTTATGVNLAISLGWVTDNQGANFNPSGALVQGRYNNAWSESAASLTGAGTVASPYYAKVSGYTDFGTFAVGQAGSVKDVEAPTAQCKPVEVTLGLDGTVAITAEQVDNGSSDKSGAVSLSISPRNFTSAQTGVNNVTLTVTDASGNSATCITTVTVKKRTATIVYTGDGTEQYSDKQVLSAVLKDEATGTVLSGKAIRFEIGAQSVSAATDASGGASSDLLITQDPALEYRVKSSFAGDDLFLPATDDDPFDIQQEDARAYYTGTLFGSTGSGSTTTITLSATIRDISAESVDPSTDSFEGDIRNAKVTFIDRSTNTVIATVPVGLVNGADKKVGTATYNWSVDIGNYNAKDYTIGIQVNNYYQRNVSEENTIVTVSKSLDDFISGGGYINLVRPSGQKSGDLGSRNNFGFNVKFNKSKTNLQGNFNTIIRRTEGDGVHVYQVKGNAMTSLSTTSATSATPGKAVFNGKVSIQDITSPLAPLSVDGNATVQVEMTDRNDLGTDDAIAITVWNKSGGVWFASSWDGIRSQEQTLAGGNLKINNGATATTTNLQAIVASEKELQPIELLQLEVAPNPATTNFRLTINSRPDEGDVHISILDISGRLIETMEIAPSRKVIQLGDAYRPGIYLVEVTQGSERKIMKLIKSSL